MSILGLMDSRALVYRFDKTPTNRLGDPSKVPSLIAKDVRCAVQHPRFLRSHDDAAGERMLGSATLFIDAKVDVQLNDVIYIESGNNTDSWWLIYSYPFKNTHAHNKEMYIKPYVGATPNVPGKN